MKEVLVKGKLESPLRSRILVLMGPFGRAFKRHVAVHLRSSDG